MVFVKSLAAYPSGTGLVAPRGDSTKNFALLCVECIFGIVVALSNMLLILILVMGWRRFMRNHFYIVLANLIVFTSLKGFVELVFILPYYIRRINDESQAFGYFSKPYELLIFNISVLADYGVLFFSVLIAVNRYMAVSTTSYSEKKSSILKTALSCIIVWLCSMIIPICYYFLECQYAYQIKQFEENVYYYKCLNMPDGSIELIVLNCLVYLSYACAIAVLILYCLIFVFLRNQRKHMPRTDKSDGTSRTQMKLLKQSFFIFALYASSILAVFAITFANASAYVSICDISYAENLLNLSIAAVYPICFLSMSGEMRNVLLSKVVPRSSDRVSSIGSNPIT